MGAGLSKASAFDKGSTFVGGVGISGVCFPGFPTSVFRCISRRWRG